MYCPRVNVVGRWLKISRRLESMRNWKGSEGGNSTVSAKSVDSTKDATQIADKVMSDTIMIALTQETKDGVALSFECSTAPISMVPRWVRCPEINGG
jgi:hypothetical protein